ncbi:MAG: hypothetical protein ACE5K0_09585 [Candidatus Methanofastidiosia archaeon]
MNKKVKVTIYRFTGKQLFFNIDSKYCRECDLTIEVAEKVTRELGILQQFL